MFLSRTMRGIAILAVALSGVIASGPATAQAEETGSASDRQLLFYNHAYGVLDRETADAIEHSDYLRDFASFEVRTTTGGGMTWTGRYLYGRETYLELFGVGDLPGRDGEFGTAAVAVSVERAGDLEPVRQRLREQGIEPTPLSQTRDFGDGVPVPWFDGFFISTDYDKFGMWSMEYRPEYFADPRSEKTEPPAFPGDISRERYQSDAYRDHLMRDVSGIRIALTQRDLDSNVPLLSAGGFDVRSVPGGVVATRGGTTIRLDAVPLDKVGLQRVELALNRPVPRRHVEQIGQSTLVVGPGAKAVWTFKGTA
jgi:hypothetical protein